MHHIPIFARRIAAGAALASCLAVAATATATPTATPTATKTSSRPAAPDRLFAPEASARSAFASAPAAGPRSATVIPTTQVDPATDPVLATEAAAALGVASADLMRIAGPIGVDPVLSLDFVDVEGVPRTIDMSRASVRDLGYRLLVDDGSGRLEVVTPGPVNTYRGTVRDVPGAIVVAGVEDDGLHLMIDWPDRERTWIEPLERRLDAAPAGMHAIYRDGSVLPHGFRCGNDAIDAADQLGAAPIDPDGGVVEGGGLCTAQLACDADFQYFQDYGSVGAVEARINTIINVVNNQYEGDVGITHAITAIVVRSNSNDPYTQTDAEDRLCEFITEWTNNQTGIVRDVAHLFTGQALNGSTIGIAADIGGTGICVNNGGCFGGTFGTFGSYCLSQSDFNNNFGCATDLTAHELGHLWGAFHCNCSGFTMNPSITCANDFSGGSISSISAYRDSRPCLDCGGPTLANDACSAAELIPSTFGLLVDTSDATPVFGGTDPELPSGSPSCQWNGAPEDTHNTVWYRFVASQSSALIQTCDSPETTDTILVLYGGSCGSLVELACGEDQCGSNGFESAICATGLVPGQTYFIMLGHPGSWTGSLPGNLGLDVFSPCPDIGADGACCLPNGTCDIRPQGACVAAGGTFNGEGTNCAGTPCGPDCPGDFDDDGEVAFGDLVALLSSFGPCAGCPQDLNGDGAVAFDDLVALLSAFGPCD